MMSILIIGMLLMVLAWWRPVFGLAVLILAWPSYLWRISIAHIPSTALEIWIYAAVIGVIGNTIRSRRAWRWPAWSRPVIVWTLLWSIAWLIAVVWSPDHRAAFGALKAWWFDPALFAALIITTVRTDNDRRTLLKSLILSGTIVAVGGIFQMVFLRSTLQEGRLSSFFAPVANYAAMYLAPLFVLAVGAVSQRILTRRWLWFAGVMGAALLATLSYGGLLSAGVGPLIIWLWMPAGKLKKRLAWIAVVAAILGGGILLGSKNFHQHFDTGRSSGEVRKQIWVVSWALIRQHPITGIGPNNFEPAYTQELPKHYFPPLEWLVAQPHNLWLALWLETGLLGLITFLLGMTAWVRAVWRSRRQAFDQPWASIALIAMVALIVHGFVDTPIFKNDLVLLFGALLVLPFVGRNEQSS